MTDPSSEPVREPEPTPSGSSVRASSGTRERAGTVGLTLLLLFLVLTVIGLVTGLPGPVVTGMQVTLLVGRSSSPRRSSSPTWRRPPTGG